MEPLDKETAAKLYKHYRRNRDGIRNEPAMASLCLICASVHIARKVDNELILFCRNCNFAFYRYACSSCGATVDGRDPQNPACPVCCARICTCGVCECSATVG
jgi:hypothetical protein